ncbi:aspartate--tRNA ligase msd1 [Pestalotiopsis sp. IQ-011]
MRSVALRCLAGTRRQIYAQVARPVSSHWVSAKQHPGHVRWTSHNTTTQDLPPQEEKNAASGEQISASTAPATATDQGEVGQDDQIAASGAQVLGSTTPVSATGQGQGGQKKADQAKADQAKADQAKAEQVKARRAEARETLQKLTESTTYGSFQGFEKGAAVTVYGFLGKRRDKSSRLTFYDLDTDGQADLQIVSKVQGDVANNTQEERSPDWVVNLHKILKAIPAYSPVMVQGVLDYRPRPVKRENGEQDDQDDSSCSAWDIRPSSVRVLNEFSKDTIVSEDAVWSQSQRHLQLRFDPLLRQRLQLRSLVNYAARNTLMHTGFHEYETPMLFKSTPEGAREFLVPTRQPGLAYALPQSPQQSKQVLMASGIRKYFQFARCFRDEDSRADRQPEFTQLDLEMGFARGRDVRNIVELILRNIFRTLRGSKTPRQVGGVLYSSHKELFEQYPYERVVGQTQPISRNCWPVSDLFVRKRLLELRYHDAMACYGTDKPDLRIPTPIRRIDDFISDDFKSMITSLSDPIVEAIQFKLNGTPSEHMAFIREIMENLPKTTLKLGTGSTPGVFVFDTSKPLNGLSAFGHEAGAQIASGRGYWPALKDGDLLIVHARERTDFKGEGWTELGRLRKTIYDAAVQKGLMDRNISFRFLWVKNFPLFTPDVDPGEGQGGAAGVKATHHPFTAPLRPLSESDWQSIEAGKPWLVNGEHYDLVLNGAEVGGGSRRIHRRAEQETIMRTILKMPESGIAQFKHLLDALDAGCPPHAGFAFGWDRLISMLCDVESVRDVMAFPKNQKGEDLFANSPSQLTQSQLDTYHLTPTDWAVPEAASKTAPETAPETKATDATFSKGADEVP